ncbi:TPA: hypothetical protein HMG10_18290 [Escherichia coli]|nr:hypothetical protein [Escherichia coli]
MTPFVIQFQRVRDIARSVPELRKKIINQMKNKDLINYFCLWRENFSLNLYLYLSSIIKKDKYLRREQRNIISSARKRIPVH